VTDSVTLRVDSIVTIGMNLDYRVFTRESGAS